jgi:hypothetical protein
VEYGDRAVSGWIGVDLDGTLAEYHGWNDGIIGKPVAKMVDRVKRWIAQGREVRIFTARAFVSTYDCCDAGLRLTHEPPHIPDCPIGAIAAWSLEHIGVALPVTCTKDFGMVELWDDRAISVACNTGEIVKRYDAELPVSRATA